MNHSTPESIKTFREKYLDVDTLWRALVRWGAILLNLLQGFGKSYALKSLITHKVVKTQQMVVIIASENNRVLDEYQDFLIEKESDILRLYGRSKESCNLFETIQSLQAKGLHKKVQYLCKCCEAKCPYYIAKKRLKQEASRVSYILLTYTYLKGNNWILDIFEERTTLLVLDEPSFLAPDFQNISKKELYELSEKYRNVSNSLTPHIDILANVIDSLLQGKPVSAVSSLTLEEEIILSNNNIMNAVELVNAIIYQKIMPCNDVYKIPHKLRIFADYLIIAAPVRKSIINKLYPYQEIFEISIPRIEIPDGTQIIRVNHSAASFKSFYGNLDRLSALVSTIVLLQKEEGRRTLLVVRKAMIPDTIVELNKKFSALHSSIKVRKFTGDVSEDHNIVYIINYGVSGFNSFEHFSNVVALSSYYVPAEVIDEHLKFCEFGNDAISSVHSIETLDNNRIVTGLFSDETRKLLEDLLHFNEVNVILQAIFRIRALTYTGKLVVVFYKGDLGLGETVVDTFEELRYLLQIPDYQQIKNFQQKLKIIAYKQQGMSNTEIANMLNISERTVYNRLKEIRNEL